MKVWFWKRKKDRYTTTEAAEELGIGKHGVQRLIQRKRLPASRFGREYEISRQDLEQEMRRRGIDPDANGTA